MASNRGRLMVPDNISLLHLPPYSPELNPTENIWQFLQQNYLSKRVCETYTACCNAWNKLEAMPDTIRCHRQTPLGKNDRCMSPLV